MKLKVLSNLKLYKNFEKTEEVYNCGQCQLK